MSQRTKHTAQSVVTRSYMKHITPLGREQRRCILNTAGEMSKELGKTMEYSEGLEDTWVTREEMSRSVCSGH